jgi:hypothetical protein
MANEGGSSVERALSVVLRLLISLILPAWGAVMLALGFRWGARWWIATGAIVIAIGIIFLGGSPIVTSFIPGGRKSE